MFKLPLLDRGALRNGKTNCHKQHTVQSQTFFIPFDSQLLFICCCCRYPMFLTFMYILIPHGIPRVTLVTLFLCLITGIYRYVQVKRGSTFLSSGDSYVAGESLTVVLSSTSGEIILETSGGAAFQSGQCTGNKRYGSNPYG